MSFSITLSTVIVMLLNFLVLLPFLYSVTKYMKYVMRVVLDTERRAIAAGEKENYSGVAKIMRFLVNRSNWLITLMLDFVILIITPSSVDLWGHILVLIFGIVLIVFTMIYTYVRRS